MSGMKIAVVGASGRMGRMIIESILQDGEATLVSAIEQPGTGAIGKDAGELVGTPCGVPVSIDAEAGIAQADCLIDFTRPEGTLEHLAICRRHKVAIVIGTTGFNDEGKKAIADAALEIPVVFAPNMSVGVNAVFKLLDTATRILAEGYDIEIVEAHHRHKVDAPSGTALKTAHGRGGRTDTRARSQDQCRLWPRRRNRRARSSDHWFCYRARW